MAQAGRRGDSRAASPVWTARGSARQCCGERARAFGAGPCQASPLEAVRSRRLLQGLGFGLAFERVFLGVRLTRLLRSPGCRLRSAAGTRRRKFTGEIDGLQACVLLGVQHGDDLFDPRLGVGVGHLLGRIEVLQALGKRRCLLRGSDSIAMSPVKSSSLRHQREMQIAFWLLHRGLSRPCRRTAALAPEPPCRLPKRRGRDCIDRRGQTTPPPPEEAV